MGKIAPTPKVCGMADQPEHFGASEAGPGIRKEGFWGRK